ncbi:MAG TPA: GxxExxY protein [Terriglobales bacterium]|jgi:GxxExxY protein|nr:GxxExxY protein [Terriglobales bacterium]
MSDQGFKHVELTETLIGIFFEVYNELGYGFLESVYEEAYCLVLTSPGISFQRQYPVTVSFRGMNVGEFRSDLVVESSVIIEMKAVQKLDISHEKQLLNYLRATNFEVGLLLNFGPSAQIRRLALDNARKTIRRAASSTI